MAVKSCLAIAAQLHETPFFLTANGKVASHHYLNQTRHDVSRLDSMQVKLVKNFLTPWQAFVLTRKIFSICVLPLVVEALNLCLNNSFVWPLIYTVLKVEN